MIVELPIYNRIIIALIDLIGIWLAISVYKGIAKKSLARIFLYSIGTMLVWVNFAFFARLVGQARPDLGLMSLKIAWFATPFLFVFLHMLVISYLDKEKQYKFLNNLILFLGLGVSLTTLLTGLIVNDIEFVGSDLTIIYGAGMWVFLGVIAFFMVVPLYILIKAYFNADPARKTKIEYLLTGILIFYIANAIFNISYPIFFGVFDLYWLGDYSSIILLGIIAYAIVARELFGIKVILTALLVSLIAILLGFDIFVFTPQLSIKIYKGVALIVFLYFGFSLIKSVIKEIIYRERLAKLYALEKKARAEVEKIGEAKTQFARATQHDIKNHLTSMIGFLEFIFDGTYGKVPVKLKDPLMKSQVSAKRLMRMADSLLDFSKFQTGKGTVTLETNVDFDKIVREILEEVDFEIKDKDLYLKYEKEGEIPNIKADSEKLKVALFNIIDNAIKYTNKGGITLILSKNKRNIRLEVRDTGIGLEPEKAKQLFSSVFLRGKEAQKIHGSGKGVGMYVTGYIIKAHGGKIWAESKGKNKGTSFFIELLAS